MNREGYASISPGDHGRRVLSASDPAAYTYAVVQVSTAALKYTTDGTAPSATVGMNVAVGGSLTMNYALFNVAKFYSATGTLDIEFYV